MEFAQLHKNKTDHSDSIRESCQSTQQLWFETQQKDKNTKKKMVTRVGFEPTPISRLAPEASALDRSAILPVRVEIVSDKVPHVSCSVPTRSPD